MPTSNDYARVEFSNAGVDEPSQFSSDVSGDPRDLAREADDSREAFLELQQFLNNSLQTPGSRVCHDMRETYRPDHTKNQSADFSGFQNSGPAANNLATDISENGPNPAFPETEDQSLDEWSERPW